jgi:C-terminal processing protease CtpA/Prc
VPTATRDDTRELAVRRANAGVERVEVLPGNVGLLALTHFFRLSEARATLAAAMAVLAHADALVLDLRENGGGSPDTVAFLASYLFDRPALPLFDIQDRGGETTPFATASPVPEGADARRPVFVLTSARTFSAGEGAAFLLQARARAVVIGEATPGAANPGRPYPVGRFEVTIPNGRVRVAPRGDNWEGTGVVPDVPVAADAALPMAQERALRILIERAPAGAWQQSLRAALDRLGPAPR